jgi:glucosylceramidase
LTDAAAETFYTLPRETQKQILRACCDAREGIGYSLGRTHINSCDFSSESCTCVQHGDTQLKSFSIAHDLKYRIPFIKEVLAAAGNEFSIFACPWSPPAWMKDNHDMLHGGELMPQFYDSWANYYVKFIKACEKEGIPIWGLTVQNEPMAVPPRESCVFTASEECDSVKSHLGPIMAKSGLEDKKILIWDHNHRSMMYQRAEVVLDDPEAARYVRGVAFHWCTGDHFENVISSSTSDDLLTTAFLNRDGRIVVIVMNASAKAQPFFLWLAGRAAFTGSPAHSIMTLAI